VAAVALGVPSSTQLISLHTRELGVSQGLLLMESWMMGSSTGLDTAIPRVIESCMILEGVILVYVGAYIYRIVIIFTAFQHTRTARTECLNFLGYLQRPIGYVWAWCCWYSRLPFPSSRK
jgi:hypothetical protein